MSSVDMTHALRALERAIRPPRPGSSLGNWRFAVRQRLGLVREALAGPDVALDVRTRNDLTARVVRLAGDVLERPDVDSVRAEVRRLLVDVHAQAQAF